MGIFRKVIFSIQNYYHQKLAEFVCQTENFSNFILGEHSGKGVFIILLATQIHNFCRYSPNFQRVNFGSN